MKNVEILFKRIENIVGYSLPKDFKEIYSKDSKEKIQLMTLDEIIMQVSSKYNDSNSNDLFNINPIDSILPKAFDPKRVPFIQDGAGNFVGIDFNPGKEGVVGQIINYGCDEFDMNVFAYKFKDFIEGINECDIAEDIYITDYLMENNVFFGKDKTKDASIIKLPNNKLEKQIIENENIHEISINIKFEMSVLKNIIDILINLNENVKNNSNVIMYENQGFLYRIINKKDSLSRTMETEKSFYNKLNEYNIDEIKGYSFSVSNYIEEKKHEKLYTGQEKIFIEINILTNTLLVRYRETIENENMKKAYKNLIDYANSLSIKVVNTLEN